MASQLSCIIEGGMAHHGSQMESHLASGSCLLPIGRTSHGFILGTSRGNSQLDSDAARINELRRVKELASPRPPSAETLPIRIEISHVRISLPDNRPPRYHFQCLGWLRL